MLEANEWMSYLLIVIQREKQDPKISTLRVLKLFEENWKQQETRTEKDNIKEIENEVIKAHDKLFTDALTRNKRRKGVEEMSMKHKL